MGEMNIAAMPGFSSDAGCARHDWRTVAGGRLARCSGCQLVVTARVPDFSYEAEYFTDSDGGGYDFDADFSRHFDAERFGAELRRLERTLRPGTLLDIGCATGTYLTMARDRGWRVTGVEVAAFARATAIERSGAHVVASCDELPRGDIFDVVTLHHVLEHVHAPVEFLRRAVAPRVGRRLLIEVPNFDSLGSRVYGAQWRDLRLDQHVTHFTRKTLAATVSAAGLRVIQTYTLWNPLWSLRATVELGTLLAGSARDLRWDDVADGNTAMAGSAAAAAHYRRPAGARKVLTRAAQLTTRPIVRVLESAGLGERLVVEAEPVR